MIKQKSITNIYYFFGLFIIFNCTFLLQYVNGNEDAKRLYDDLLINYNKYRRPSHNPREPITVKLKLRLSQIIDVVNTN